VHDKVTWYDAPKIRVLPVITLPQIYDIFTALWLYNRCCQPTTTTTTTTTTNNNNNTNVMDYSAAITQLRGHFTKSRYKTVAQLNADVC